MATFSKYLPIGNNTALSELPENLGKFMTIDVKDKKSVLGESDIINLEETFQSDIGEPVLRSDIGEPVSRSEVTSSLARFDTGIPLKREEVKSVKTEEAIDIVKISENKSSLVQELNEVTGNDHRKKN